MKKMTKKKKLFRKVTALAAVVALGASLAGCGSSGEETTQRYSWPLATASPEDTVTQIFAEKFAEEISELSDGRMKTVSYTHLDVYKRQGKCYFFNIHETGNLLFVTKQKDEPNRGKRQFDLNT